MPEKSFCDQYIADALRTEAADNSNELSKRMIDSVRLLHAAMGIATEAGEIVDQLKKHIFYGKSLDVINLVEELGDIDWYKAVMCDALGVSFEDVMDRNIRKLKARYPEKFASRNAIFRDLEAERAVLETPATNQ